MSLVWKAGGNAGHRGLEKTCGGNMWAQAFPLACFCPLIHDHITFTSALVLGYKTRSKGNVGATCIRHHWISRYVWNVLGLNCSHLALMWDLNPQQVGCGRCCDLCCPSSLSSQGRRSEATSLALLEIAILVTVRAETCLAANHSWKSQPHHFPFLLCVGFPDLTLYFCAGGGNIPFELSGIYWKCFSNGLHWEKRADGLNPTITLYPTLIRYPCFCFAQGKCL